MDRRGFLRASGVVSASALAGCAGVLNGAQPEKAGKRITAAEEKISKNTEALDEIQSKVESDDEEVPDEFDPSSVTARVEKANVKLDEAEEYATDEQQSYVDTLRQVGEYQKKRAKLYEDYVSLSNKITTVNTYVQSDRYDTALEKVTEAKSLLDEVRTHTDEMESALGDIDSDALSESDQITYDAIETDLSTFRDRLDLVETMLDGFAPMIKGIQDFMPALEVYKNGQYADAAEQLAEAEKHFETADAKFRELENADTDLGGVETDVAKITCYTGVLTDGARLFKESATAAKNGDKELARQKAKEAQTELNKCSFDSSS
ncbi:twin-arginine translocation signal domain-containing protein [Halorussus aquaticus]|uniref:Tat (Twin-arginine translocation) pathway signal sequence n=1 Tax=Halorussus aquaticus TaxID=2953748 RepID=A0ABD5Q2U3_9EURY|nr:hypothetical protein [Halorussus aquaticus]